MHRLAWLLAAACSSGAPGPAHPRTATAAPPASGPSDRECDELFTHAVKLGIDEQAAQQDPPRSSASDHEDVRRKLHEDFMAGCHTLPRDALHCAMVATTLTELAGCQATPSSSTSNNSVAPGGMTPPAPRSP